LPEPVAAGGLRGICPAPLVIVRHHGNVHGWVFAVPSELGGPESDLTEITVVGALLRFVIVFLLEIVVTLMTQF
jgi:hypothetical protein